MKVLTLKRVALRTDGTFGVLLDEGNDPFCVTVERPWENNKPEISCIPKGEYTLKRVNSPRFGDTFEVTGVPGRSHILFHKANVYTDLKGCIGLGEQFEPLNGINAVLQSGVAFGEFMRRMVGRDEAKLVILEV